MLRVVPIAYIIHPEHYSIVANKLAKHYAGISTLQYQPEDREVKTKARRLIKAHRSNAKVTTDTSLFNKVFTPDELERALATIQPYKAPGGDMIHGHFLRHLGPKAKNKLLSVVNESWIQSRLPNEWRSSVVIPILKQGKDPTEPKSYRPISLTSTLCKLTERMIHSRLIIWLEQNHKLDRFQTAYRSGHSIEDQLMYFVEGVIDGFQHKPTKRTAAIFLDMSAAFDKVWTNKLICKMAQVGIKDRALLWITSFLKRRRISVRVNQAYSRSHRLYSGVPQGSVLSPLLFLLYTTNIAEAITPETHVGMYADDIAIWNINDDIYDMERQINNSLEGVMRWSRDLKLQLNPTKTTFAMFTTDRRHRDIAPNITMDGVPIEATQNPKYLGLHLDTELRFSRHIDEIGKRAMKRINILRKTMWHNLGCKGKDSSDDVHD
jgi:hypothetical protein